MERDGEGWREMERDGEGHLISKRAPVHYFKCANHFVPGLPANTPIKKSAVTRMKTGRRYEDGTKLVR